MSIFLIILFVLAALGALFALIRGIVAFLQTTEAELKGEGPNVSAQKQNKMMMMRVGFQALAVILIALLLLLKR